LSAASFPIRGSPPTDSRPDPPPIAIFARSGTENVPPRPRDSLLPTPCLSN
jgi:hypothetical protein